jgi:hypothetical protein
MEMREVQLWHVYWWNAARDVKILVRVIAKHPKFWSLRVQAATPAECLLINQGVGEIVQVAPQPGLLEKVS